MRSDAEEDDDLGVNSDHPDGNWGGQSTYAPGREKSANDRGLAPTDLTALPKESRKLITWLARRQMANLEDIQQALNKKRDLVRSNRPGFLTRLLAFRKYRRRGVFECSP